MQSPRSLHSSVVEDKTPQKQPIKNQIVEVFNKLNNEIDQMNNKIYFLMTKHEAQFVLAYQGHTEKIKQDLQILRDRTNYLEKELRNNDRAIQMSKQATIFREQSLRLYEKLEQKSQQCQIYKFKAKQLQKTYQIMMKQIRESFKGKKILQTRLSVAQQQIAQLQMKLTQKQGTIKEINQQLASQNTKISRTKSFDHQNVQKSPKLLFNYLDKNQTFIHTKITEFSKKSHNEFKKKTISLAIGRDNQLKQWFLDCVKSIKKQIATRKNSSSQINLQNIQSIQDFKMIDKLKLLQKFLQNQKLLVWMYEKIFPSRTNEIRQYISDRNTSIIQNQRFLTLEGFHTNSSNLISSEKQKNYGFSAMKLDQRVQITLPKMQTSKQKHNYTRKKVFVSGGHLNLVNPQFSSDKK